MQVRDLTKMAMCVALCCVTAHISFPLPFTPGYVTALTFAMSLSAYLLPPRQTFTVILIYILMGAVGLPVFATGEGLSRLVGPVGGFYFAWLIAYPLLSLVKGSPPNLRRYAVANILIAVPITYAGGLASMMLVLDVGLLQAMTMAVLPFIPGDLMKATAAALLGVKVQKILEER
ncbi:MAG: biotin transporter BioY [Selenomonadaceae bacterium]|nr:biotin transporter BioY [Selenomonadaceae bacterium]MBQ4495751.1 biotin transporter BioY [Selenomonadaceae bacterium]